jgi:hypothetical protein
MDVKPEIGAETLTEGSAEAMRVGNFTEVKFQGNEEAQQNKGIVTDPPRAELPAGKPVGDRALDDPLGEALTIRQVSELLGCSPWTVRNRHLRRGLPYFRVGGAGKLVFYRSQITRWILEQQAIHRGRR